LIVVGPTCEADNRLEEYHMVTVVGRYGLLDAESYKIVIGTLGGIGRRLDGQRGMAETAENEGDAGSTEVEVNG
jgi:hypothetical protein